MTLSWNLVEISLKSSSDFIETEFRFSGDLVEIKLFAQPRFSSGLVETRICLARKATQRKARQD